MRAFTPNSTAFSTGSNDPVLAAPMVARFELQLLSELGFGLDLEQCASTGASDRSDLRLAEIGAGGVAQSPASLGPTRCCGCRPSCAIATQSPPAAISPTASHSPDFSWRGTSWSRADWRSADERAHFIAALGRALPSVA